MMKRRVIEGDLVHCVFGYNTKYKNSIYIVLKKDGTGFQLLTNNGKLQHCWRDEIDFI